MHFGQSLLSKHIVVSATFVLLAGALFSTTFYLTTHIQGEVERINLAGRQRMPVFHIANHAHFLTAFPNIIHNRNLHYV